MKKTIALTLSAALSALAANPVLDKVIAGDPDPRADVIQYNKLITPKCDAMERYNTVFHVPTGEKIIDVAVGDSVIWVSGLSSMGDAAYVKPQMMGLKTNVDISTDKGNHYSCFVEDRSGVKDYHPKLNIFFEPTDREMLDALKQKAKFVPMSEFEAMQHAADQYKLAAEQAGSEAAQRVQEVKATAKAEVLAHITEDYEVPNKAKESPFYVTHVARDDHHTYIFVDKGKLNTGAEAGSVFEKLDGKLAMLPPAYDSQMHAYVTTHAIQGEAVLKIGKKEVSFKRK
ncbi:MAG: TrbG/VirB9 family P-type conjugative transfer protein [Bryobacteraceae bacterium]|jgi:type IV secretory pathway VirB9-like protein